MVSGTSNVAKVKIIIAMIFKTSFIAFKPSIGLVFFLNEKKSLFYKI
jgi:hypothetical protein